MLVSIVISVFNEEEVLQQFYNTLNNTTNNLNISFEFIFVNDGSTDNSLKILYEIFNNDQRVKVINFSRNFGHESAMLAGLEASKGDIIICMDSDLQHPPQKITEILDKYNEGYEVISMVRDFRDDAGRLNNAFSSMFYKLLNKLSAQTFEVNASDFFAISKRVKDIIVMHFNDRNRFLRGYIQQVGFKRTVIHYHAPSRAAGSTKYSFSKLLLFSISVIVANSRAPLRFSIIIAFLFALFSIALAVYSIIMKFIGNPFSGYTTIIVFLSLAFSLLFFVIGILGEYIGNIYSEIKSRPIYIIDSVFEHNKS